MPLYKRIFADVDGSPTSDKVLVIRSAIPVSTSRSLCRRSP